MKKLLVVLVMGLGLAGTAQEANNIQTDTLAPKKHEIKVNAAYLLAGTPEIYYEYILNEESALGISVAVSLEEQIDINYMVAPYYRLYFGKKYAAGFFIEANAAAFSHDYEHQYYSNDAVFHEEIHTEFGAGVGISIGGKLMTKSGWIGEIIGGAGRNFVNNQYSQNAYTRFGINIGKRF